MSWIKAKYFSISEDLKTLDKNLSSSRINHRITEENGQQVLWVPENTDPDHLVSIIKRSESETSLNPASKNSGEQGPSQTNYSGQVSAPQKISLWQQARNTPATSLFIFIGFIGYLLITTVPNPTLNLMALFFSPATDILNTGDIWRLVTPTFLHFGILHILFNSLWMWELGKRLEIALGLKKYFVVFLIIAIGANYVQFAISHHITFGGLSGVVYGFLGLLLVLSRYSNDPGLRIPSGIYIFMIVWMFLGIFKVIDLFMDNGGVANGAHVGGFVFGLVIGGFMYASHSLKHRR